ncbi:MAG: CPBP family glutamic-type intramembrane protease, partial [Planctomycetota bacterium]
DSSQEKPELAGANAGTESNLATPQELLHKQPEAISLYDSKWNNWALAIGLIPIPAILAIQTIYRSKFEPGIWVWLLAIFASDLFLLLYPIVSRTRSERTIFKFPGLGEVGISLLIAMPCVLLMAFLDSLVSNALHFWVGSDLSNPEEIDNMVSRDSEGNTTLVPMLAFVTWGAFCEEVYFRGFLMNALRQRCGVSLACLFSSLMFSIVHYPYGWGAVLSIFLWAILISLVYQWRKSILCVIAIHVLFNASWAMTNFFAAPPANTLILGVLCEPEGQCTVTSVIPNTPAERIGLREGDTIVGLDVYQIRDFDDLQAAIYWLEADKAIWIWIERNGKTEILSVTLERRAELAEEPQDSS